MRKTHAILAITPSHRRICAVSAITLPSHVMSQAGRAFRFRIRLSSRSARREPREGSNMGCGERRFNDARRVVTVD
jgi:hypothetical protein